MWRRTILSGSKSLGVLCELAPLYALGTLDEREGAEFEAHLNECASCLDEVASYSIVAADLALVTATRPPATLRARLLESIATPPIQVWKNWSDDTAPTSASGVVRANDGEWQSTGSPGVFVRQLSLDPVRQMTSMLIRMEPGSSYPRHVHASAEECYVIQGELHVGDDVVLHAGDFQRVEEGSMHAVQSTLTGCLLFISSSLHDELVD